LNIILYCIEVYLDFNHNFFSETEEKNCIFFN